MITLKTLASAIYVGLAAFFVLVFMFWLGTLSHPAPPAQASAGNRATGPQDMGSDVWCYAGSEAGVACIDMRLRAQLAALLAERSVPPTPTRGTVVEHP